MMEQCIIFFTWNKDCLGKTWKIAGFLTIFLLILFHVNLKAQVNFTSTNLPIVIINTNGLAIPDEPKVRALMRIIDNGPGQRNNITDTPNIYSGDIGIELRGSSSQSFDKKSYGIELRTPSDQDSSASILGMPEEEDWILYGPYSDKSLMRNVLTYHIGRELGRYASRTRFCELVINDDYKGVYVMEEKIKRDKHRVDISKLNPDETSGDDLTGGYIIKIDKLEGNNSGLGFESEYPPLYSHSADQKIFFQYDYPKNDEIVEAQKNYISKFVIDFEDNLKSADFADEGIGYRSFIDVNSFIDYAIINELTRNVDAYRLSTFLYKDKDSKDGKMYMGPIWDYNLAFGNADYCDGSSISGWAWDFNKVCSEDYWQVPFWWYRFRQDIKFTTALVNRWKSLREGILKTENLMNYIDSTAQVLDESQQRNFQRWNILGIYIWPNNYIGYTYTAEINYLKQWIAQRAQWIDDNIAGLETITAAETRSESIGRPNCAYPNPFEESVNIEIGSLQKNDWKANIYDDNGQLVRKDLSVRSNQHSVIFRWDGRNDAGAIVPMGLYLFRISNTKSRTTTVKLVKR